ncbi:type IV pilin-like G/H family protein [Crocosphaera sp. XPORK-15E]|uniref:type IV pilin-like G/H family protein n=1 Tax=Crocosphaera sp. XPORK-15E TaxID=3110247 RepID=UPI002B1FBAE7|nr:type IV pilin-like G/H family protein [Crocosphaera sp. XPORK-15E]MEA5534734.1 type IV pilin-like G/H family protein [Crocosphaera sp. XPORK-15E]
MNNTFKANLIKSLANKKGNKGFTLIELLVVVIIIGVLAAIALPNLLGQVGKARESEAKTTIGALNRAQQGFFTEKSAFATSTDEVEVPIGNEKYYVIAIEANGVQFAQGSQDPVAAAGVPSATDAAIANGKNGTRDYAGAVSYDQINRSFATVVCRSTDKPAQYVLATGAAGIAATTSGVVGDGIVVGCAATGVEEVK